MPHSRVQWCWLGAVVAAAVGVIRSQGRDTTSWWLFFAAAAMFLGA